MNSPVYQIFAVRFATTHRLRKDNFYFPVEDAPESLMALDFFVWLIVGDGKVVLVDTGFSQDSSVTRGRPYVIEPAVALSQLGFPTESVQDVVVTHLHYDHAGNIGDYAHAKIWLQERELQFVASKCMCEPRLSNFFATDDIALLLKRLYRGDVRLLSGNHTLHDGIELYAVGGHTDGLQVVRVRTSQGWVVLASDAAHFYENFTSKNPFPAVFNMEHMLEGYALIEKLADGSDRIVPGHDPLVCVKYPQVGPAAPHAYRIA